MQDYKVDSHKLLYHPIEVAEWLKGEAVYPIMAEIGLSGACNHRCVFCCVDHMNHIASFLDTDIVLERIDETCAPAKLYQGSGINR